MPKHNGQGELNALQARHVRPPPRTPPPAPLPAAEEPPSAPQSLVTGPLAHHSILQGWPGGSSLESESVGGRGFAPTPNREPPAPRGGVGTTRKCGKTVKY